MKATAKSVLRRVLNRQQVTPAPAAKITEAAPVITGQVPAAMIKITERDEYVLLAAAINRADHLGIKGNTRAAAIKGMRALSIDDAATLEAIMVRAGSHGATALKSVIMELAGYGRAMATA